MKSDWLALIISYAYVFAIIGVGEGLRQAKPGAYSTEFTRKLIHISVGMWAFGTVLLFEHWYFAIVPHQPMSAEVFRSRANRQHP